ncbi:MULTISPECIES: helix-turn-helix domain-containing protein [Pseudomonas]|uniref:helix-turn-helix domain-containing protein n=1 Tax=Pseudomonas TaxID=286 RepID=UPI0009E71884|nr:MULTISPECIES: helix-turn-helix transcriptional regulator [Pseudomonas]QJQ20757.1 helix-turn-helix transcriptional regulator [Pseudomonas sp. SK]WAB95597.1 helix-turn-helix transcriptional regulator [Pseudomonas putida]HDS0927193.1 helix-turn-helix transcriptional regulator [Pseudomonas putida]HEE9764350.1 helix-turn-helix transcriptional regulator [Pseudomonas putida]
MSLKSAFASVLRALRTTRNMSQRGFAEVSSRTYLSKLETGKSSITLDKLEQLSQHLDLSPLTLLTLTLSESSGESVGELIRKLESELSSLHQGDGLTGLRVSGMESPTISQRNMPARPATHRSTGSSGMQTELAFVD